MKLLPEIFPSFFYRTQHRWYFDKNSLTDCFRQAAEGMVQLDSVKFIHTYGISNALAWLKEKCPKGDLRLDGISPIADRLWSAYLESTAQTDTLYLFAEKTKTA